MYELWDHLRSFRFAEMQVRIINFEFTLAFWIAWKKSNTKLIFGYIFWITPIIDICGLYLMTCPLFFQTLTPASYYNLFDTLINHL